MTGSYRQAHDLSQIFRNLTASRTLVEVKPGQTATLMYTLKPDLEGIEVGLGLDVDFTDEVLSSALMYISYLGSSDVVQGTCFLGKSSSH